MLVPIFLILVAIQVWSWSPLAYPFLAFLIIVGAMVANNFLLMLMFWVGVTLAGYMIFLPYWQKTQADSPLANRYDSPHFTEGKIHRQLSWIDTPFHRALFWQIATDVILLILLLLINIRPVSTIGLDTNTFPDEAWLSVAPSRRGIIFGLGASVPFLKAVAWAFMPRNGLSFTPLGSDQAYISSFVVSAGLVALLQTVRLEQACLPYTQSSMRTVIIIATTMILALLLYYWVRNAQDRHMIWHPLAILPRIGKTVSDWDKKISLGAVDLSLSSLDTLGAACIEFETHLIQLRQGLMKCLLAAQAAPKRLYRFIFKK